MQPETPQVQDTSEVDLLLSGKSIEKRTELGNTSQNEISTQRTIHPSTQSQLSDRELDSIALPIPQHRRSLSVYNRSRNLAASSSSSQIECWSESFHTVLDRPPSSLPFRIVACGFIFFCLFGTWAYLGRIDEVGQAQGHLAPKGEALEVQSIEAGKVANIAVKEGDLVKRGQLLVEFDSQVATTEVERQRETLSSYQRQLEQNQQVVAEVEKETQSRLEIANSSLEAQKVVIAQNQRAIAARQEVVSLLKIDINAHKERLNNLRPSFEDGAISREYIFNAEQALNERLSAIAQAESDRDRAIAESQKLQAELIQKQTEIDRTLSESRQRTQELEVNATQLQTNIVEINKQLEVALAKRDRLFLHAPVDGVVTSLNFKHAGEVAQQGETLAEIAPKGASLVLLAFLPDREAGFVEVGMPAQVKLDAFPYQDFGIIQGQVESIAPDADVHDKMGVVYQVEISLQAMHIESNNRTVKFKAGQTGHAEIIIRKQRIIDVLLDPIQSLREDGLSL